MKSHQLVHIPVLVTSALASAINFAGGSHQGGDTGNKGDTPR